MTTRVTGSCLCGGVAFTLTGPLRHAIACHCVQCRKTSGHYWSATAAAHTQMTFQHETTLTWYQSSDFARRGFCGACGSTLFYERAGAGQIAISAGCLDTPTGLTEAQHIFTTDKGDYYTLPTGPEQFARWTPEATAVPEDQR